jgi:hypothetical protein
MTRTVLLGGIAAVALGFAFTVPASAEMASTPAEQARTNALNDGAVSGTTASAAALNGNPAESDDRMQQTADRPFATDADIQLAQDDDAPPPPAVHQALDPAAFVALNKIDPDKLHAAPVEIASGDTVGQVRDVALGGDGAPQRVKIALTSGGQVWVPESSLRYDQDNDTLLTNMSDDDLHSMAAAEGTD